jgi:hypothetical protein
MAVIMENAYCSHHPGLDQRQTRPCDGKPWGICRLARHRHWRAPKEDEPTFHAADNIWGSSPHPARSFPNYEPRAAPTKNLGFRRQYHQWIHLGTGHTASLWCICGPRAPNTVSGSRKVIAIKHKGGTQSDNGQGPSDTCTVRGNQRLLDWKASSE